MSSSPKPDALKRVTLTTEAIAHLTEDGRPHLLSDHLNDVAHLAASFAKAFDGEEIAHLTGSWHDLGKYSAGFQQRIRVANGFECHLEAPEAGRPDHSTAGAIHAMNQVRHGSPRAAAAIAIAIAGHHAGLKSPRALNERIKSHPDRLKEALEGNPAGSLLNQGPPRVPDWLQTKASSPEVARRSEVFTRFLFSALCDADFLDTEAFYDDERSASRSDQVSLVSLRDRLRAHMGGMARTDTEVNRVRQEVLQACYASASLAPGAFSLTVPTGGGKTLASLSFALEHALHHGLSRVIMAIPFTSITEQTAGVYGGIFSDFSERAILEHHSMLDPARETYRNRLASENWDAPIVVTTNVQLFESLFANRPSKCRKLHRIARSVIVLDEAQTLPVHLLAPVLDMLRTLIQDFGCSIVFCTATQPALKRSDYVPEGLEGMQEIVPRELKAFERLRRVRVQWPDPQAGVTSYEQLAEALVAKQDVLAIVHLRNDARTLCEAMDSRLANRETLHLSALMCAAHRSDVLASIKARKKAGEAVRLVATQLVEAGVDLDFAVVYRAVAGIDSLAQAAGRCNREGLLADLGELRVFHAPSEPPRGILRTAKAIAESLIREQPDLFEPSLYERYFSQLYGLSDRDKLGIQDMRKELDFEAVAKAFAMIEDDWSASLVVPYGEAAEVVSRLKRMGPSRILMRQLQRYTVTVPRQALDGWLKRGVVERVADTVPVLGDLFHEAYDIRFGLIPTRVGEIDPAALIFGEWIG